MDLALRFALPTIVNKYVCPRVDWDNPLNSNLLYFLYGGMQCLVLLTYLYIYTKISKQDRKRRDIFVQKSSANPLQSMMGGDMSQFVFPFSLFVFYYCI